MFISRSAGILLPLSQLYGKQGFGSLGEELRHFINFVAESGNKYFQICPLGHMAKEYSPYICYSAFAGNPFLIDLQELFKEGLLNHDEIDCQFSESRVEYEKICPFIFSRLELAFTRFKEDASFEHFCKEESHWLESYALAMSIMKAQGGKPWYEWPRELKEREKKALAPFKASKDFRFFQFIQYFFFKQWQAIRHYAKDQGVQIIGDIPIYISYAAVDVWVHPDLFLLDGESSPTHVAGVPPDYFSATGQLWGNPLYDWPKHEQTHFSWWRKVFTHQTRLFDLTRIDHFRGLVAYWKIPAHEKTAIHGEWIAAPGAALMAFLAKDHPSLPFIVEDLGLITPDVIELRDKYALPGMFVTQLLLERDFDFETIPQNSVSYSGTHDNDTLWGWAHGLPPKLKEKIQKRFSCVEKEIPEKVLELSLQSYSQLSIIPIQDYLKLGSEARINTPGYFDNIYRHRLLKRQLTPELKEEIQNLLIRSKRI